MTTRTLQLHKIIALNKTEIVTQKLLSYEVRPYHIILSDAKAWDRQP